jgi:hypothetical protein
MHITPARIDDAAHDLMMQIKQDKAWDGTSTRFFLYFFAFPPTMLMSEWRHAN